MRKLATVSFAFAAGVFLCQYLLRPSWYLPLGLLCIFLCIALIVWKRPDRHLPLIAGGLAFALFWFCAYQNWIYNAADQWVDEKVENVSMVLLEYPKTSLYGASAIVRAELPEGRPIKAIYYGNYDLSDLKAGDVVIDTVTFYSGYQVQDTNDALFISEGIRLLAYGSDEPVYESGGGIQFLPAYAGHALKAKIAALFDGDIAGFLTAILTGDKTLLSSDARTDLTEAGIYHLTAVSGMHCAVLLRGLTLVTGRHRRRLTAAVGIPVLMFYMLLAGCSPSIVRACVMLTILELAPLFRRTNDPLTAMSFALMLILLQDPCAIASLSLQLSFGAVAGLLLISPRIRRHLSGGQYKIGRFIADSLSASLGVTVFTLPISAYNFGTIQLIAPLSNLLCLWAASLIFGTGLLVSVLGFLPIPLAGVLSFIPQLLIRYVLTVSHWLSLVPGHALYLTNPYLKYGLVFLYVLFFIAVLGKAAPRMYFLAAGLSAVTLTVCVQLGQLRYSGHQLDAVFLDVGQGQCILLKSGDAAAMVDCGTAESWTYPEDLSRVQLRDMGCSKLEYLLLTHYDKDHVSGTVSFLKRTRIERLLLPDVPDETGKKEAIVAAAEETGTVVEYVTVETVYNLGSASFRVYPPLGGENAGSNEQGLTALVSVEDYDLLITGDMDTATEAVLLETYEDLPDIETFVAGHHGSKNSTSADLLAALKPETAVISVGVSNSYGHPTKEALRRLVLAGVEVYRTDMQGNIHLYVNSGEAS